jgi:hypothetical protein
MIKPRKKKAFPLIPLKFGKDGGCKQAQTICSIAGAVVCLAACEQKWNSPKRAKVYPPSIVVETCFVSAKLMSTLRVSKFASGLLLHLSNHTRKSRVFMMEEVPFIFPVVQRANSGMLWRDSTLIMLADDKPRLAFKHVLEWRESKVARICF